MNETAVVADALSASRLPQPSWRLKLQRAKDHLQWLRSELHWLNAGGSYSIRLEHDDATGDDVFYLGSVADISRQWSAAVGDCVGNLRHALDHVLWELVPVADRGNKTEFPIFLDPDVYAKQSPRKLRGLAPDQATLIETLQPYHSGYEPLWTLHELSRRDKHRALLLSVAGSIGAFCIVGEKGRRLDLSSTYGGVAKAGTELFRYPANPLVPNRDTEIRFHLPLDVGFEEPDVLPAGRPVFFVLSEMTEVVERVLNTLAPSTLPFVAA